jgi:hypothetical protein
VRRKSGQPEERTGFPDVFHIGKDWGLGRLRRTAGKKQIPHDETVRNDKAFWQALKNCAQQYGAFRLDQIA